MNYLKDQKGIAFITEIILGTLVVTVIAGAVYAAMHRQAHTSVVVKERHIPMISQTPSTDPYAGWNTYTSSYQQASFKYPSTWKMTRRKSIDPSADDYDVNLTSPTGLEINYRDLVSGLGGGCDTAPLHFHLSSVEPLTNLDLEGKETVYLVQSSSGIGLIGKSETYNGEREIKSCGMYLLIDSKLHKSEGRLSFGTSFYLGNRSPAMPDAQAQDLPTAKLILKTFRY